MDLLTWAQAMGVNEVWRWKHPTVRAYSCFSTIYKTTNRIDLAFANPTMMSDVTDAMYLPSGLSYHCPLLLNIRFPSSRTSTSWRLGTHWLSHADLTNTILPRLAEYWDLSMGSSSPEVTWDAFKAFTRGKYISSIAGIHREQAATMTALQDTVKTQTETYATDPTDTHSLRAAKCDLHLHLTEVTRLDLYWNRQRFFEQGDCNGHLLAMLAQHDQPLTVIPNIVSPSGESASALPDILDTFRQ